MGVFFLGPGRPAGRPKGTQDLDMAVIILRGRFDAKLALASVIPMLLFQNRTRRHQDSLETASRRPRNAPMHFKGLSRPS